MNKKNCGDCGILLRIRCLQKYKGKLICKGCKRKKEKKKGFVSVADIKKEEKELEKRVPKKIFVPELINLAIKKSIESKAMLNTLKKIIKKPKTKETEPKVPGSKVRKKYNPNLRRGLSFDEQKFLLRKHMNLGASFERAKEIINENKEFLSNFVKKMRKKKKSEEEIRKKFKEEFAKLLEK